MEIVKPGKLPEEEVYEATCRNCFCVFRFKQKEAEVIYCQRDGDYMKIKCPTVGCNREVYVSMR